MEVLGLRVFEGRSVTHEGVTFLKCMREEKKRRGCGCGCWRGELFVSFFLSFFFLYLPLLGCFVVGAVGVVVVLLPSIVLPSAYDFLGYV